MKNKNKKKAERNSTVSLAYLDGYFQIEIALYLELSKSLISKVIKSRGFNDNDLTLEETIKLHRQRGTEDFIK